MNSEGINKGIEVNSPDFCASGIRFAAMADYINADISYIKESDAYSGADASHYKESHDYINADIRYIKETDVYIFRDLSHIKEIESYRHADGACRQTMAGGSEEMAGYISADASYSKEIEFYRKASQFV